MITLGQASNYGFGRTLRHLLAWGTKRDFARLREGLAEHYQVKPEEVALYHTGRSALTAALKAVAPEGGAKVLVPGLTCIAVIRAIKAANCEPVFVDIAAENLEYDYEKLEKELRKSGFLKKTLELSRKTSEESLANSSERRRQQDYLQNNLELSKKTLDKNGNLCYNRGIILVQSTLGQPWHAEKIQKIAQKYNLAIVEDLAHSAGRNYAEGIETGLIGEAAALSFGKGKAIDTISGGAVIVRGRQQIRLPERQQTQQQDRQNSQSAKQQEQNLPKLDQPTLRPKLADRLRDRWYPVFGGIARILWRCKLGRIFIGGLVKIGWVQRSADAELDLSHCLTYWQAKLAYRQLQNLPKTPLRDYRLVENRSEALQKLNQAGYCLEEIWYDTPVSPARYAKEADFPAKQCPETVRIAQQIINIPTWYSPEKLEKAYEIIDAEATTRAERQSRADPVDSAENPQLRKLNPTDDPEELTSESEAKS